MAALRAWERRFGFPRPDRLPGGHRRYAEAEVGRIEQVVAERARGRSIESAIEQVSQAAVPVEVSLHAALRRRRADLPVHLLSRRAMRAISRAIEDEGSALAGSPVLVAAFQREAVFRRAAPRWDELARPAAAAVVFADFAVSRRPPQGPVEVALPASSPLRREWAVLCDGPGFGACLAGFERPGAPDGRFEAVWSVEPEVVRLATRLALDLAHHLAPGLLPSPPGPASPPEVASVPRWATALTNRVVGYLDR